MLEQIPTEALAAPVTGVGLTPGKLIDQLEGGPQLLVFLRHFGCVFCRETVADLRAIAESDPTFPRVLFFFVGSSTEGRAFMRRYWPGVRAVADPEKRLYAAFGVERGGVLQMFGPGVWSGKRRARSKGHEQGERSGDIWMMPAAYLVDGATILWQHEYAHAADHPDFARIPALVGSSAGP
ncbi:MAG: SelL-related redox protein [Myxococcales bacterium]|nr:SelL-related redox protein [Myxococcales bacterium]